MIAKCHYKISIRIVRIDQTIRKGGGGVATFVNVNWYRSGIDCLTLGYCSENLNKYSYIHITNISVTPNRTSAALSVFTDESTKFAVNSFNGSLSIVCGDFNSRDCSFLSSLGHQNVVDFPTRLDVHLDLVFINDMGIYVTCKRAQLSSPDQFYLKYMASLERVHCYIRQRKSNTGITQKKIS
ncbi:hypothetical protein MS3_00000919 [Schistosoma haematobium]|uniref:Endonuclease/exonuclease/phosphatase domain-containing protein n=1 Tax=Schistosoma haematobium TaxID=6185 RepID=A0A922LYZ6_SCHHA|nr:hypothetical protein MS3_00000919 [Schistosoma haematobium]KAH9596394.1 hypothetical protein MS3_00000919 [Schistosoma haematobium]